MRLLACIALAACGAAPAWAQCPDGRPCGSRAPAHRYSVAVLTFDTRGIDTTQAYLGEQLADEVTGALATIERLVVKGRRLVIAQERTQSRNPAAIARALTVRYLVDGSLQQVGSQLRARVQLTRAGDGVVQWDKAFTGTTDSLLVMQERIARDVATAITGRLFPTETARLAVKQTGSGTAYAHYLRGNALMARRSEASIAAATREYSAALRLDPGYARALARLAYIHGFYLRRGWDPPMPREILVDSGLALARRAIRMDSAAADGWIALGYIEQFSSNYEVARAAFERAVRNEPRNAEAWHRLASASRLDTDAGMTALLTALSIEPDRAVTMSDMGFALNLQRMPRQAQFWLDSAIALDSTLVLAREIRVATRLQLGDTAGARHDATFLDPRLNAPTLMMLAMAVGDTTGARRLFDSTWEQRTDNYSRAWLYGIMADRRALDHLERAPLTVALFELLQGRHFDFLRSEARFQAVVRAANARFRPNEP